VVDPTNHAFKLLIRCYLICWVKRFQSVSVFINTTEYC